MCKLYVLFASFLIPAFLYFRIDSSKTIQGPSCLNIKPAVGKDEFLPGGDKDVSQICPGEYDHSKGPSWDLNFNVPRTFRFEPNTGVTVTTTTVPLLMRLPYWLAPSTYGQTTGVPKLFHFIWTDEIIPSNFVNNIQLFRKHHPGWTFHFWTLTTGEKFIRENEPFLLDYYQQAINVYKSDVLRYAILYHIGGAYFDLDNTPLKSVDDLANRHTCMVGPEPMENVMTVPKRRSVLANSALLCVHRHPFYRRLLDEIPHRASHRIPNGPPFFADCFNLFLETVLSDMMSDSNQVNAASFEMTILPHEYFEYNLNKGNWVDTKIERLCYPYRLHATKYLALCSEVHLKNSTQCLYMYKEVRGGQRNAFEACVEWLTHGGKNRLPSNDRYMHHPHFGTHKDGGLKKLTFSEENHISKILTGVIIH